MNHKNIFTLNAVLSLIYGLGFVLMPAQLYDVYGIDTTDELIYTSNLFGAALIGFAVLSWMARTAGDSQARRAIVTSFFVGESLGFVLAVIGQFRDSAVDLGWLNVVIYLVLALAFGYLLFMKSGTE